jgi:hypothetical protein
MHVYRRHSDVSEEYLVSIFRVEERYKQETGSLCLVSFLDLFFVLKMEAIYSSETAELY